MPFRIATTALVLAVLGWRFAGAAAQDPLQPTFRTGVDLVRVDVSVTTGAGEALTGLQASDFEVEEDGVPVKVETLQFVRLDGTRTSETDESLEIRSPEHAAREAAREDVRLFAIFLDDYHVEKSPTITALSRRVLKALVERFGPNDLIAIVDPLTPLSHIRFTRSRAELLARVESFEGRKGEIFPVRSVMEEAQLREPNLWELRGGVTLSALGAVVTHLAGLREGRKSVVFLSQGPVLGSFSGPNEDRLREVVEAANRGNVTIHVVDPRPLGASPFGGPDVLFRLYHETGGRALVNSNDHAERLDEIMADASAYYLLGYAPSRAFADGRFHRIEVKVKRRGARVLARRGYWAPTAEERTPSTAPAPEPGLAAALSELPDVRSARPLHVWMGTSRTAADRSRVSITWEPARRPGGGRPTARLTVERLRSANDDGGAEERYTIGPAALGRDASVATFEGAPGENLALRFTASAADGSVVDRWDQTVRFPEFPPNGLALATPRFLRTRSAYEAQAMRGGQDPPPAASREFQPTDRVFVEVECYAPAGGLALSAQLLNAKGEPLTAIEVPPPSPDGRARLTLPLASLAPATYVLQLHARAGDRHAETRSAFRVVP